MEVKKIKKKTTLRQLCVLQSTHKCHIIWTTIHTRYIEVFLPCKRKMRNGIKVQLEKLEMKSLLLASVGFVMHLNRKEVCYCERYMSRHQWRIRWISQYIQPGRWCCCFGGGGGIDMKIDIKSSYQKQRCRTTFIQTHMHSSIGNRT